MVKRVYEAVDVRYVLDSVGKLRHLKQDHGL